MALVNRAKDLKHKRQTIMEPDPIKYATIYEGRYIILKLKRLGVQT
jgi:hypothetical protein